ncbi:MAG: hypothetical protein KKD74_11520 [Bacteroidetes bacterium]|nr:hypothetical protein [Bacteroidota bacterium]
MKKIAILLVMILAGLGTYAQKSERTNAFMYNKNGQYDKAREAIDKAIVHEKTLNDPKTWMYRGIIYLNITFNDEFKSLDPNALQKSLESFIKAKELDPEDKEGMAMDINPRIDAIGQKYFEMGVQGFNNQDYNTALLNFNKAADVATYNNKVDTLALLNSGLSSIKGENFKQAIVSYNKLLDMNFSEPDIYKNLALAYRSLDDKENMLAVIKKGRAKFPEDPGLLLEEINSYLAMGQGEKVIDDLKDLVVRDPSNYSIFFVLGTIYGDETDSVLYNSKLAEDYYLKAIEINPEYYDAIYNLGALYINESNKIQVKANDLPLSDTKSYEKYTEQANVIIRKALPYLEKANELMPNNEETITVLKTIYVRFKMDDKLKALTGK